MVKLGRINHGGIMANYECNAACRHCLYACSPDRAEGYITEEAADKIGGLLVKGGCRSVHIGGGEPFLDFDGLMTLLATLKKHGIKVEYVETNACFAADEAQAASYLKQLLKVGADTLCISLDPFHAEYVPYALPLKLAEICRQNKFGYFLWQERFLHMLTGTAADRPHKRSDLEKSISPDYVYETARSYGLGYGGRALNIELEYGEPKPLSDILSTKPCKNLASTNHFHVDLYGNFIPPGCTGIEIPLEIALKGIDEAVYPVFNALYNGGPASLSELAKSKGFVPEEAYTSACAFCFFARKWLSENTDFPELNSAHYEASLSYYT